MKLNLNKSPIKKRIRVVKMDKKSIIKTLGVLSENKIVVVFQDGTASIFSRTEDDDWYISSSISSESAQILIKEATCKH